MGCNSFYSKLAYRNNNHYNYELGKSIKIHKFLMDNNLKSKMIMQVHDELVFDLHKDEQEHVKKNIIKLMEGAAQLEVPMQVEVGIGKNWLEAH
jgi:DNA polymerase-1